MYFQEVTSLLKSNLRRILTLTGAIAALVLTLFMLDEIRSVLRIEHLSTLQAAGTVALGTSLGGLIGFLLAPVVGWMESRLSRTPLQDIMAGALGLIIGLIIANLLGSIASQIPLLGGLIAILASLVFGYLGMTIAAKKREEMAGIFSFWKSSSGKDKSKMEGSVQPKILDTSVIIDGRIADICKTGFLEGPLVIPGFVLEELRHIADSADVLKRNRGRRGLDILNRIQKELAIQVQIYEKDLGANLEVDSKLVRLGKMLGGKVITNDYNLNKVAELQGVPVLNINELANAVKPVVLPGEEMMVHIIKDGKEFGQGVAYLDDGTMIVVDGGKKYIGDTVGVLVTSVLQTAAGRMIFAKPKSFAERVAP